MKLKNKKPKYIYVARFGHFGYSWTIVSFSKKECIENCKNHNSLKHMPQSYIEGLPIRFTINKIKSNDNY